MGSNANAAREQQQGAEHAPIVPLPGTVYEKVLRTQVPDLRTNGSGHYRLVVPVTDRGDAMGVIEMDLPWEPGPLEVKDVQLPPARSPTSSSAVGATPTCSSGRSGSLPFSLAAEIQRRLLPAAFTCEAGQLTVSGWLEPANAVGGDTSTTPSTATPCTCPSPTRSGTTCMLRCSPHYWSAVCVTVEGVTLDLLAQAAGANDALVAHSGTGDFVTGQLVRVDRHRARMSIVNAGHPFPFRVRKGVVERIKLPSTCLSASLRVAASWLSRSRSAG